MFLEDLHRKRNDDEKRQQTVAKVQSLRASPSASPSSSITKVQIQNEVIQIKLTSVRYTHHVRCSVHSHSSRFIHILSLQE